MELLSDRSWFCKDRVPIIYYSKSRIFQLRDPSTPEKEKVYEYPNVLHEEFLPECLLPFLTTAICLWCFQKTKRWNQLSIQWLQNGEECVESHTDTTPKRDPKEPILLLFFGEMRTLRVRTKSGRFVRDFRLQSGDSFVMGGDFQKQFKHEIVKEDVNIGSSFLLTFRVVN